MIPRLLGTVPLVAGDVLVVAGRGGVVLEAAAVDELLRWRQQPEDLEACGVLIGKQAEDGSVYVTAATGPLPGDARGTTWCERTDPGHQAAVAAAWAESEGVLNLAGSWHTHPHPWPVPSSVDTEDWVKHSTFLLAQGYDRRVLWLIVGTERVTVWEVVPVDASAHFSAQPLTPPRAPG